MGKFTTPKKKKTAIVLMALVLILGAVSFAAAKYVSNHRKEAEIHASNFHFSSDYLAYSEVPEFTVSDWSRDIRFRLFNYELENAALISDTDILYAITVSNDWSLSVTDSQGNPVTAADGSYTLPRSDSHSYHLVTLSYKGTGKTPTAEVTVLSSSPYSKELKAIFKAATEAAVTYTVDDKGHYAVVTIHTNQYAGPITVGWDAGNHSPDNTNDLMAAWTGAATGTFSAKEFSTYTLIFTENQTHSSQKNDFTVGTGA